MKKKQLLNVLFIFLIQCYCFEGFSQKYKVSDDVITKDKVPVGKVTGVSNLVKANFIIYGMEGQKVISVYRDEFKAPNVLLSDRYWYNLRFEDTGKEMWLPMSTEFSVKSVLNKTLPAANIFIDGNVIPNQDEIIAKYDIKDSIIRDTTYMSASNGKLVELIKSEGVTRDRNKSLGYRFESKETLRDTTFSRWSIIQDDVKIGSVVERTKYEFGKYVSTYLVYKELVNNSEKEVPIALGIPAITQLKISTIVDHNNNHSASLGNENNISAQVDPIGVMVKYLLAKKYF